MKKIIAIMGLLLVGIGERLQGMEVDRPNNNPKTIHILTGYGQGGPIYDHHTPDWLYNEYGQHVTHQAKSGVNPKRLAQQSYKWQLLSSFQKPYINQGKIQFNPCHGDRTVVKKTEPSVQSSWWRRIYTQKATETGIFVVWDGNSTVAPGVKFQVAEDITITYPKNPIEGTYYQYKKTFPPITTTATRWGNVSLAATAAL